MNDNSLPPIPTPPTPPELPTLTSSPKFHPYFLKLFVPFLAVLVLIAGLGIGTNLIRNPQKTSTSASASLVDLSLSPSASTLQLQDTVTINVTINTQTYKITAVDLGISYPIDKFDAVSFVPGTFITNILTPATFNNGVAHIVLGSGTSPKQGSGILATLTLRAKAAGSATIAFNSTQIAGVDSSGAAVPTNILGDANSTSLTVSQASTTPTPSPSPSPSGQATPTPNPTPTPAAGEPNSCSGTCGSNYNCQAGLYCYQGFCRNPLCKTDSTCKCLATPTPSPKSQTPKNPQATPEIVEWTPEPISPTVTPTLIPDPTPLVSETKSPPFPYLTVIAVSAAIASLAFFLFKKFASHPPLDTPPTPPSQ
mgnify:CR=1 FL=1